jgi:hypothetical protein
MHKFIAFLLASTLAVCCTFAKQLHEETPPAATSYIGSEPGAIGRTLQAKLNELHSILDWAKCDNSTNDTEAVQAAFNSGYPILVPGGSNCLVSPGIRIRPGLIVLGEASASATASDYANFAASRFIFTGKGSAGFVNANSSAPLNEGAFKGISVTTAAGAQVDWLFDLRGTISWVFDDDRFENTWSRGGGLRSRAVSANPTTWLNHMRGVLVRVPDAGTGSPFDVDWSDSSIVSSVFTGGIGSYYRGPGNTSFIGSQFERSSAAGVVISKELASAGSVMFSGCAFDANKTYGIAITVASSPGGTTFMPAIVGSTFRNNGATADIYFDPAGVGSLITRRVL